MDRLASYFRHDLPTYVKQRGPEHPHPTIEALAELARGTAREGHVVLCVNASPELGPEPRCASCYSAFNVVPYRVPRGTTQYVALICETCLAKQASLRNGQKGYGMRYLSDRISNMLASASPDATFDEVLLIPAGSRIRMVTGRDLDTEVLS